MAVHWNLKLFLAHRHGIYSGTALQKLIVKKTGVLISIQNLCQYLRQKPKRIQIQTMELICSALDCKLSDFCNIEPKKYSSSSTPKKLAPQNIPHSKKGKVAFPNPLDYQT